MSDQSLEAGPHDVPATKEFPLPDGTTAVAKRQDPFGFWHFVIEGVKELPHKLSGHFTSTYEVEKAVQEHINIVKDKVENKKSK